jgi:hypothetical protein
MDITSGLLDTINGKIPAFPQVYNPAPQLVMTQPGYVWKKQMFPEMEFVESQPSVKSGVIPHARKITKLL